MINPTIKFLHVSFDQVNCASIKGEGDKKGLEAHVDSLDGASRGDILEISFKGYSDAAGTQLIPESTRSFKRFLEESEIPKGFDLPVATWRESVKHIKDGSARVSITINGGSYAEDFKRAFFMMPDGSLCFP